MTKLRLVPPDGTLPPDDGDWEHWADGISDKPTHEQRAWIQKFIALAEVEDRLRSAVREAWDSMIQRLRLQGKDPTPEQIAASLRDELFMGPRGYFKSDSSVAFALESLRDHDVPRSTILAATGWTPGAYKARLRRGRRRPVRD